VTEIGCAPSDTRTRGYAAPMTAREESHMQQTTTGEVVFGTVATVAPTITSSTFPTPAATDPGGKVETQPTRLRLVE
jgi:hypothetical protein